MFVKNSDNMMGIIKHTIKAYTKNLNLIFVFSIPLLIAFLIPIFVQLPTFSAAGGIYLRTGSLPNLSLIDIIIMVCSFLISLYLISLAIVNINLIIKAQRTSLNIKREVIKRMKTSTLNVFLLYITFTLILFAIQLLTYRIGMQNILAPILSLLAAVPFFYAPSALVIDDVSPEKAVLSSINHIRRKILSFIFFLIVGFILISILTFVLLNINLGGIESLLIIVLNSLIIIPILVVMQTQIFISKYSIIH
ncbi:MAG: hypothetical protein WC356_07490 [Candidatus Micrarchaeia archaeon]|jgi:hypothetical protein